MSTGAHQIAQNLHDLGVRVIFGLVGVPVVQIAEEAIKLGIRFIAFRNEQSASYAATAYGYLTGKPGVCLVVGGPGVLHAWAGIGNSEANRWPLLLMAGSAERDSVTKGNFQEMDAISLLQPHTKIAVRATLDNIPSMLTTAYRNAWYGTQGTGFIDLPADVIQGDAEHGSTRPVAVPARAAGDPERIAQAARLLKSAKAPLVIIGKGAAFARAENGLRQLVDSTGIPFLPTPMGKGVINDSHPANTSAARSVALKNADVVLIIGARLNWILHFGEEPKWASNVKIIQVDHSAEELGKNRGDDSLAIVGDINLVVSQLNSALHNFTYPSSTDYWSALAASTKKNEATSAKAALVDRVPMTYHRVFDIVKRTLHELSPPDNGEIVYVSEGANTMDISRSIFNVSHPRLRIDAGTSATMGVGMGYAIAAHMAYNIPNPEGFAGPSKKPKKIVCLEGDSAFGFSLAEVETMARYKMPILIYVINNSGVYHGDANDASAWAEKQAATIAGKGEGGLRSSSLGWEIGYEKVAEMCGGKGYLVRTPQELERATREGYASDTVTVVNVIIEAGQQKKLVSLKFLRKDIVSQPSPTKLHFGSRSEGRLQRHNAEE